MVSMHCVHMESYLQTYLTNKNTTIESQIAGKFQHHEDPSGLEG